MDKMGYNSISQLGSQGGYGLFSNVNLGVLSLMLKYFIVRIDFKRDQVWVLDVELCLFMNEVCKNWSKWVSEENVGQEEFYEVLDKVFSEFKVYIEFLMLFLNCVNKRDVLDYYNIIR